jgi:hypothetical protein
VFIAPGTLRNAFHEAGEFVFTLKDRAEALHVG